MAPFRHGHAEYEHEHELPWLLMLNGPVTKYWRRAIVEKGLAERRVFADLKARLVPSD